MRAIYKRLAAGVLSTTLLFCQMGFTAMASTKETIMTTDMLPTITALKNLSKEVTNRTISVGATEEEISKALAFPERITATVETTVYEQVERSFNSDIISDEDARTASDSDAKEDMPTVYAAEGRLKVYIWVFNENKQSFAYGRLPDGKSYEPGFLMGAGGMPTHEKLNKHGVTTISLPRNNDNKYQYYTVGDISYGEEKRKVYDDRHPILTIPEDECILKIELALWRQGYNKFTFIRPGDSDYPADPLNPEEKTNPTKTFQGFVGNGTNGMEGVTITAKHPQSGHTKSTTTNAVGEYRIELDEVKFGTIHLTAEIGGRKLLTPDGKQYHAITFYAADTTKKYDFGDPTASREYAIKMIGGTANPTKAVKDTTVSISAGAPSPGKTFKRWISSDNVTFADGKAEKTTFKMPAGNVTITAEFETVSGDIKTYKGSTNTDTFTYGDTITVKVVPTAGILPTASMALYDNKRNRISAPAAAENSTYTMTVGTGGKAFAIGLNSITAKYTDSQDAVGTVAVKLNRKALTTATINSSHLSASKTYDGSNRFYGVPLNNLNGLLSGDIVQATADGISGSTDVGQHLFTATTVPVLSGSSAGYYTLAPAVINGTVKIEKADAPRIPDLIMEKKDTETGVQSIDLNKLFKSYGTAVSYEKGTVTGSTNIVTVGEITGGQLKYTLNGGSAGDTVKIPVTAVLQNYHNTTVNIIVTLANKYISEVTIPDITVTYGQPMSKINISGVAKVGDITVAGTFAYHGEPTFIPSVGSHVIDVIFTPEDRETYAKVTASANLFVKKAPTSDGGGGSSGGGGGSTGPATVRQDTSGTKLIGNVRVPDYVTEGNWSKTASGIWTFSGIGGQNYANTWVAAFNPYANVTIGQQAFDWFAFDGVGNMVTGWYAAADGNTYYLNPNSDNTLGAMKTGWVLIEGRYYYFNEISDGARGKLLRNTKTPDGYFVDANGVWDGKSL